MPHTGLQPPDINLTEIVEGSFNFLVLLSNKICNLLASAFVCKLSTTLKLFSFLLLKPFSFFLRMRRNKIESDQDDFEENSPNTFRQLRNY